MGTALQIATQRGHLNAIIALLNHGAQINFKNEVRVNDWRWLNFRKMETHLFIMPVPMVKLMLQNYFSIVALIQSSRIRLIWFIQD